MGVVSVSVVGAVMASAWSAVLLARAGAVGVSRWGVVAAVGALAVLMTLRLGPVPLLPADLGLLAAGAPLALVDAATRRLPNAVLGPAAVGEVVLVAAGAAVSGQPLTLARAVAGALTAGVFFFLVALAARGGLGGGDVKLAALLGLVLSAAGWRQLTAGVLLGLLLAAIATGVVVILRRARPDARVPLGPFLVAGALLVLM